MVRHLYQVVYSYMDTNLEIKTCQSQIYICTELLVPENTLRRKYYK